MEDEKKMRETEKRTKYKLDLYGDVFPMGNCSRLNPIGE